MGKWCEKVVEVIWLIEIRIYIYIYIFFFFQAEDGIRDWSVTGVQTCALPICILDVTKIGLLENDHKLNTHVRTIHLS